MPAKPRKRGADDPLKRVNAALKRAAAEYDQVQAGDGSRCVEALRLYVEGLELLEEIVASGQFKEAHRAKLQRKIKGARKRIAALRDGQQPELETQTAKTAPLEPTLEPEPTLQPDAGTEPEPEPEDMGPEPRPEWVQHNTPEVSSADCPRPLNCPPHPPRLVSTRHRRSGRISGT